jgi:membrane protease YdiL (CAAX protease family)
MNNLNKYTRIFSFIVVGFFIILGLFLVFSDYFSYIPRNYRIIFAFLLVAYGSFRFVTILNKPKKETDEDE